MVCGFRRKPCWEALILRRCRRRVEIRYAPGGDENYQNIPNYLFFQFEIRYAPGGDENTIILLPLHSIITLRLDMPREGTKT